MLSVPSLRSQLPPSVLLILGSLLIFTAGVFAYTGKASLRFHDWVYRDKEPAWFWWQVALYFFGGVGLIGYFLYLAN